MLTTILHLTGAIVIYMVVTVFLWKYWQKNPEHTTKQKLMVGLAYGVCAIVSSHIGINHSDMMILNARDLGPLAAGLFFGPLPGILAGLMGGIERFIIGEFFDIASFTRVACGASTILAGFLSAALHKWVFLGRRPTSINCLFLGAAMEVFHMYNILITNRDDSYLSNYIVEVSAMPMILCVGIGLAFCALVINWLSGTGIKTFWVRKNTPLEIRFQRWLLLLVVALIVSSYAINYNRQVRKKLDEEEISLLTELSLYKDQFMEKHDLGELKTKLENRNHNSLSYYLLVDSEKMLQYTMLDAETEAEAVPADPDDVAFIVQHAEEPPFETNFERFGFIPYLCIARQLDGPYYVLAGTSIHNIDLDMLESFFLEILIFTAMYLALTVLNKRLIVDNLDSVNRSLDRITEGKLDETMAIEESEEFTRLSGSINKTVGALRELIGQAEEKMKEELRLAALIQESTLPKVFSLPTKQLDLFASMNPAKQVGGDFYDFFYTDIGQLVLVMADVSGKGIPAAMFMMQAKTAIKNNARSGFGPAEILQNVNTLLCEGNDANMFVTVWLGMLEIKTGRMRCANAGHELPGLMRAGGNYELLEDERGFVLGGFRGIEIPEYEIRLNPGDRLFVYTDGVTEATNENGKMFMKERLKACLNRMKDQPQKQTLEGVLQSIREFVGEAEQFDDITMLGLTYEKDGLLG